ncbi:glyoxalase [Patiriisocius hiemis]|uniref:Glyoxalase n=1 Tax=Patiriisocius hiemis TaxID=3075604 RepID=A0ABU2YB15_9FLAO|nr:glyoxalase [Constantimarinum sp. W242]MDT0555382.1 glyoxalase [Constantimarinum sp. W242]
MNTQIKSIRAFIGAKDYTTSREFYKQLGFEEIITSAKMSYFKKGDFGFYLQDYYAKDWVDNSMIFLEVEDLPKELERIKSLGIVSKYKGARLSEIHKNHWGEEFFLHDPSGVLWHIGRFY